MFAVEKRHQWVDKNQMVLYGHRSIVNQVRYNPQRCVLASSWVEKVIKVNLQTLNWVLSWFIKLIFLNCSCGRHLSWRSGPAASLKRYKTSRSVRYSLTRNIFHWYVQTTKPKQSLSDNFFYFHPARTWRMITAIKTPTKILAWLHSLTISCSRKSRDGAVRAPITAVITHRRIHRALIVPLPTRSRHILRL